MSGYKGVCICYLAYLGSARWPVFGYFPDEVRRIYLLRASVDKSSSLACFRTGH
jgi:hypothetical protein